MKKLFVLAVLSLLGIAQIVAQASDYVPFVREGVKWVCFYYNDGSNPYPYWDIHFQPGRNYFTLELKGDAEIGGKTYKAMHLYSGEAINPEADTVLMYLREEDRIVYGVVPDGKTYPEYYIGYGELAIRDAVLAGEEFILLDFDDPATYYEQMCQRHINQQGMHFEYLGADEVITGNRQSKRHRFNLRSDYELYFIEGIGVDGYNPGCPFSYMNIWRNIGQEPSYYLSHVEENGEVIYKGVNYEYIAPWDGHLPMAREGAKWVNEKVIVNRGDTTRYYYTYEIKGEDPRDIGRVNCRYKQCHYYAGQNINEGKDSVISLLYDCYNTFYVEDWENLAMEKVVEENRNLFRRDGGYSNLLYYIIHDDTQYYMTYPTASEYLSYQKGPRSTWLLNTDNFFRIEDIELEGHRCNRLVYVDEQGEPLAYLVEGIGFDSRDMGDLLTPFTRQPDLDADYQEYCGLSHVINKEGEIIYKGMRYDEDRVQAMYNDINGDGIVDVLDVTCLIARILQSDSQSPHLSHSADVTDVVRLIAYVLEH